MATFTPVKMAQSNAANTTENTVYTVPGATSAIVKEIVIANVTASAATLSISLVPSAGTAGDTNRIVKDVSFPANSVSTLDIMEVMNTGDFISIKQGTASAITTTISGVTFV